MLHFSRVPILASLPLFVLLSPRDAVVPSQKVGLEWVWRVQVPSEKVVTTGSLG